MAWRNSGGPPAPPPAPRTFRFPGGPFLIYLTAFLTGAITWTAIGVTKAVNPMLPWEYPVLSPFIGMTFQGGAPLGLRFLNHAAETWLPFLAAFVVARALTQGRARFFGAVITYAAFLLWSGAMVILAMSDLPIRPLFYLGAAGSFLGGFGLYLWQISPHLSASHPPPLR